MPGMQGYSAMSSSNLTMHAILQVWRSILAQALPHLAFEGTEVLRVWEEEEKNWKTFLDEAEPT
jgi:hypothetical protein